ncbi:hypothetical protein EIP91_003066 [Steccherinum ochraceum]|uniref:F-box domain-containing protein n=1 Tax=Steccherinum ochraceum TaxID=92696 RepID=A0A4R0RHB2_9APHY|nr:hypothetical protein EIP91_003066 [Steccherinum ochraceum]
MPNTFVQACNIPAELLMEVFQYLQHVSAPSDGWLTVAHICRRWRAVALNCQTLWAGIRFPQDPSYVATFVERSGNTPLRLMARPTEGDDQVALAAIEPLVSRFVELDVELHGEAIAQLDAYFRHAWQNLQTLYLTSVEGVCTTVNFDASSPTNLRTLSLSAVAPMPWPGATLVFKNLRTLHLSRLEDAGVRPTLVQFLDTLEHCPMLEDLRLYKAGPQILGGGTYPEPERIVRLGRLRVLDFSMNRDVDLAYLLSHLDIPASTHLKLKKRWYNAPVVSISRCLPRDRSRLRSLFAFQCLHLTQTDTMLTVSGYIDGHRSSDVNNIGRCFRIALNDRLPSVSIRSALPQLVSLFESVAVTGLTISCKLHHFARVDAACWRDVFTRFQAVHTLNLRFKNKESSHWDDVKVETCVKNLRTILHALRPPQTDDPTQNSSLPAPLSQLTLLNLSQLKDAVAERAADDISQLLDARKAALIMSPVVAKFRIMVNSSQWTGLQRPTASLSDGSSSSPSPATTTTVVVVDLVVWPFFAAPTLVTL